MTTSQEEEDSMVSQLTALAEAGRAEDIRALLSSSGSSAELLPSAPMVAAATTGHLRAMQALLARSAEVAIGKAFLHAAHLGRVGAVQLLLERVRPAIRRSGIRAACVGRQLEALELILSRSVDDFHECGQCLKAAAEAGEAATVRVLLRRRPGLRDSCWRR